MSADPKPYSREWFRARLGDEIHEDIERQAREAPAPTEATKAAIRRIFAPMPASLAAQPEHTLAA